MDKRWILILIIMIIAVFCGYIIVSTSDSVGNAIIDINKSTAVLPPGFSVGETDSTSTSLYKRDGQETIFIKDLGKGDFALNEINKKKDSYSKNPDIEILDDTDTISENSKLYTIYYQNNSNTDSLNQSISYLNKYNHTFVIKCSKFSDIDQIDENLNILAETIKPDYKKSQE